MDIKALFEFCPRESKTRIRQNVRQNANFHSRSRPTV
jgi:hypothetical protein